jgi:hypothetical protein
VCQIPDAVDTVVCAPDDGWRYYPKHVEQFPVMNKLCKVASCWIYIYIYIEIYLTVMLMNTPYPGITYHAVSGDNYHSSQMIYQ